VHTQIDKLEKWPRWVVWLEDHCPKEKTTEVPGHINVCSIAGCLLTEEGKKFSQKFSLVVVLLGDTIDVITDSI
jgi:hypothetical protein